MTDALKPLVLVVDDDDAMRGSVAFLLASVGLDSRGFATAEAFLAQLPDDGRPGCVILDVRMPGMSGLELQRLLAERKFVLPLVIVTGHGDVPMAVSALKAGAHDFIEKPFNDQVLLDAVTAAIRASREKLADAANRDVVEKRLASLTRREREVLDRVLAGKPNKQIAFDLDLSIKTVEVHRHAVMEKMAARSVAELAQLMVGLG
ncbi:response regulator transcription factor [Paramagnetospirillum magneticum]|uniref:Response regulator n=1 Tax=Paramagnetospirillum magneticum (strain ATCC 700264 / AMB-1) TaxID=342108 RepID=Q2W231_PARM1|nr:response regulator transcription factor [Paramagnetospirillum magneticum]BAE52094.1 Response regulator [Paramagnetospirillum magneticum AMB-1]